MMGLKNTTVKYQVEFFSLDDLVPANHLVRKLEKAINLNFIYELVTGLYSSLGKESIDPVVLIKLNIIQYVFGIRSMRQTIKEVEVNASYRWYIGYGLTEKIPHFSTFSKNYARRFEGTDLFEHIFSKIVDEIMKYRFIDTENLFIDGSHIKANANNHKYQKSEAHKSAKFYETQLQKEVTKDRMEHGKKSLKENLAEPTQKEIKQSTTDPDAKHRGLSRVKMELNLLFACMNLKKLANRLWKNGLTPLLLYFFLTIVNIHEDNYCKIQMAF